MREQSIEIRYRRPRLPGFVYQSRLQFVAKKIAVSRLSARGIQPQCCVKRMRLHQCIGSPLRVCPVAEYIGIDPSGSPINQNDLLLIREAFH